VARERSITIRHIAVEAGVSVGTASNALAGRPTVAPELRARVVEAALRMNYRPNSVAANLRRHKSRTVGLCIPALNNPFFCDLMQRLVGLAEEDGYELLVLETREDGRDEGKKLETLYSNRVRGIFMVPTAAWKGDRDSNVPMIVVDRIRSEEGLPSVALDNHAAGAAAFEALYELGHKSIWMVVNSRKIWNSRLRAEGFLAAAKRSRAKDARVLEVGMTPQETAMTLGDALRTLPPTAIVTGSGIATLGTLRALQDHGLSTPADISVLGFDDVPWMEVLRPSISVVAQPIEEIGRRAWKLMLAAFEGKSGPEHVLLEAKIIHRESTRRIGARDGRK
jgi:LacI family transcriptional regulator